MDEPVLGATAVGRTVREKDSGGSDAEQAVYEDLGAIIAHVAIWRDDLCTHH